MEGGEDGAGGASRMREYIARELIGNGLDCVSCIQASVLKLWQGQEANKAAAIEVAGALAKANSEAQRGLFTGPHPTLLASQSLHETHRGWSNAAP